MACQTGLLPYVWRSAAFASDSIGYLTAEEMRELGDEIAELFGRYGDRVLNKQLRPAEAKPVKLVAFGHPIHRLPPATNRSTRLGSICKDGHRRVVGK
jgi:hypothetical protein